MRSEFRLMALASVICLAAACGSPGEQPAAPPQSAAPAADSGAATAPAPAAPGGAAAPSTPSAPATPSASSAAPGSPAALTPPAPAKPMMMEMVVPSGTALLLTLETPVSSETAKPEQAVRARVAKPVVVDGMTVIPEGAPVTGVVVAAERSGRVKGRASIALRFNEVTVAKTEYKINTARIAREAEATKGEDATKVGIGAGAGAIIGGIAGGKKGVGIGAGVGGAAGTGVVLATRGEEVEIAAGTTLRTTIQEAVKINAEM